MLRKVGFGELKALTKLMASMTGVLSGSVYDRRDLSVVVVGKSEQAGLGVILASLLQGRRGVILLGDGEQLAADPSWASFLGWCRLNKLISSCKL